ncbi:gibberellin 3-beta-dioxygenase 1-like [Olea europaea var. sylvestris]|uniref:gibberellin 3beta-dioxygenase n=1 Tax=Olea europaea subsp. europaea TaxID=158383 RepID=A0A8S0V2A3_OLEEU|nr:gibberellin 3-beta-dioxygenase 1-like [Olea europaea var. sylvestris]CAA3023317.1 gibberellin 3-beta-dioxygenase 1-like [Olea europaea subsp. europaea]
MATLSEAYGDSPLGLQHIIPLDFDSIHELPDSHIWSDHVNDHDSEKYTHLKHAPKNEESSVPIIDLSAPNVVELVGNACETWGMFHVINHGVSSILVNNVESHARQLFSLPTQHKLKALRAPGGATGYGVARISPFFSKLMWHEGFTIMGSTVEHAKELWPHGYEDFCNVMDNYQKRMKSLAYQIMLLILKFLDITKEEEEEVISVSSIHESDADGALQLNSYPCCPDPNRAIGLAPHTDSLLLTILHQSETKGLQIHRNGVGWVPVPPVSGALVVNIGDLLHILSNGRLPTVYHRAVPNQDRHRVSVAYFYGPPVESIIGPLNKLPSPIYRSLTVKEYISLKNKHRGKALSLIKI